MNIDYQSHARNHDEAVAYIDEDGDLCIKATSDKAVVCLIGDTGYEGEPGVPELLYWEPERATQLFFPGDTITITF